MSVVSNGMAYGVHDAGVPGPSAFASAQPPPPHPPHPPQPPPHPPHAGQHHGHFPPPPPQQHAYSPPRTAADLMRVGTRDFEIIRKLGDGSFGTVFLANWKSPLPSDMVPSTMHTTRASEFKGKRLVAIKRMKKPYADWNDCLRLRELKVRALLRPRPDCADCLRAL